MNEETKELNGAEIAVKIAGGQTALARKMTEKGKKISPQAIQAWIDVAKVVPAKSAKLVHEITGVPLNILNPKVY